MFNMLLFALWETLYMSFTSLIFAYAIGIPLAVFLYISRKEGLRPMPKANFIVGGIVNLLRSVPFVILLVILFPITRAVMLKATGTRAFIFPLIVCAAPYIARMVEASLLELPHGTLEAALSMGASDFQIIKLMLRESLPSLINGAGISFVTILSYTAMASVSGGGGLGALAITKGMNLRKFDIMYVASIMLIVLVQLVSVMSTYFNNTLDHRKKNGGK